MKLARQMASCVILLLLLLAQTAAHAAPLRSPWDSAKVDVTDAPYACPAVPVIPRDLTMDGFYRLDDPTHSIIDPARQAAYNKAAEPVKSAGLAIVAAADNFRTTGSRAAAKCALSLIHALAAQHSMDGKMSSSRPTTFRVGSRERLRLPA